MHFDFKVNQELALRILSYFFERFKIRQEVSNFFSSTLGIFRFFIIVFVFVIKDQKPINIHFVNVAT